MLPEQMKHALAGHTVHMLIQKIATKKTHMKKINASAVH